MVKKVQERIRCREIAVHDGKRAATGKQEEKSFSTTTVFVIFWKRSENLSLHEGGQTRENQRKIVGFIIIDTVRTAVGCQHEVAEEPFAFGVSRRESHCSHFSYTRQQHLDNRVRMK